MESVTFSGIEDPFVSLTDGAFAFTVSLVEGVFFKGTDPVLTTGFETGFDTGLDAGLETGFETGFGSTFLGGIV